MCDKHINIRYCCHNFDDLAMPAIPPTHPTHTHTTHTSATLVWVSSPEC